jgi:hypothetical protein
MPVPGQVHTSILERHRRRTLNLWNEEFDIPENIRAEAFDIKKMVEDK